MYEEFDATIKKLMALIRKVAISLLARSSVNLIFSVLYFLLIGCNSKTVKIGPFEGDLIEEKSLHSGSESVKAYRLFETGSERSPVNEFKVVEILDQRFDVINLYQGFFASWTRKEILNSGADGSISQIDFRLIRYKEDLRILSRIKIEGHHFEHSDGALFFVKYGCCAIPSSTYIYNYLGEKLAECAGDLYLIDREHNDTKLIFCVDAGYLDQNLKMNPSLLLVEIIPQISKPNDDQPFVYAVKKFEISEFKPHGSVLITKTGLNVDHRAYDFLNYHGKKFDIFMNVKEANFNLVMYSSECSDDVKFKPEINGCEREFNFPLKFSD